ncbi:MAG: stalk domain-containing protein, partial [Cellulosilyticaceae bacterium]
MKKKGLITILCGIIGIMSSTVYAVENNKLVAEKVQFKVVVDNNKFTPNTPIIVIDEVTYLPLTELAEILGVKVNWSSQEGYLEISKNNVVEEVKSLQDANGLKVTHIYPN